MSFWTFGFHNVSAIETILEREEFTLEDLLDEEDILQEVKTQNTRLLDFITQQEQLKKILDYLTVEATPDADDKYKFKFPYIACEVLCVQVTALFDAICGNEEFLEQIFSFLEREPPLPTTLTPYVCRVAMSLLEHKSRRVIEFLKKREDFIPKLLKHISNPPLIDFILKLISVDPPAEEDIDIIGWLTEAKLLSNMIDKFDASMDEQVHENVAACLVEIIEECGEAKGAFIEQLASRENMTKLFSHLLADVPNTSGLLQGLSVLIKLMSRYQDTPHDFDTPLEETPELVKVTLERVSTFHEMMVKGKDQFTFTSTIGEMKQFGVYRLKMLGFFLGLVKLDYKCVHDKLLEVKFFTACLDLFFEYMWNNFLHHVVDDIMQVVFSGSNVALQLALLKDCKLLDRIIEANKGNDEDCEKPKGIRRGYMGNLNRIASAVAEAIDATPELSAFAKEHDGWSGFITDVLTPLQQMEAKPLGGHKPTSFLQSLSGVSIGHSLGANNQGADDEEEDDDDLAYDEEEEDEDDDENDLEFSDSTGFVPDSFSSDGDGDLERASPKHDDEVEKDDSHELDPVITPEIDEDPATEEVKDVETPEQAVEDSEKPSGEEDSDKSAPAEADADSTEADSTEESESTDEADTKEDDADAEIN